MKNKTKKTLKIQRVSFLFLWGLAARLFSCCYDLLRPADHCADIDSLATAKAGKFFTSGGVDTDESRINTGDCGNCFAHLRNHGSDFGFCTFDCDGDTDHFLSTRHVFHCFFQIFCTVGDTGFAHIICRLTQNVDTGCVGNSVGKCMQNDITITVCRKTEVYVFVRNTT